MKVHTLAATDTQTNTREVLTQTVQIRFSLRLLRLIGYTALLGTMGVSASWADNCTGYDAGVTRCTILPEASARPSSSKRRTANSTNGVLRPPR